MGYLTLDPAYGVPIAEIHTNYPGSWTWQSTYDIPGTPTSTYWPNFIEGLGAVEVSDDLRDAMQARVTAYADMASGIDASSRQGEVDFVRAQGEALRNDIGALPGFEWEVKLTPPFYRKSKNGLLEELNDAQRAMLERRGLVGRYEEGPGFVESIPSSVVETAKELPGDTAALLIAAKKKADEESLKYVVMVGLVALAGAYAYSYVTTKGALRAGGR